MKGQKVAQPDAPVFIGDLSSLMPAVMVCPTADNGIAVTQTPDSQHQQNTPYIMLEILRLKVRQ